MLVRSIKIVTLHNQAACTWSPYCSFRIAVLPTSATMLQVLFKTPESLGQT
jgi:hypothetical protein